MWRRYGENTWCMMRIEWLSMSLSINKHKSIENSLFIINLCLLLYQTCLTMFSWYLLWPSHTSGWVHLPMTQTTTMKCPRTLNLSWIFFRRTHGSPSTPASCLWYLSHTFSRTLRLFRIFGWNALTDV